MSCDVYIVSLQKVFYKLRIVDLKSKNLKNVFKNLRSKTPKNREPVLKGEKRFLFFDPCIIDAEKIKHGSSKTFMLICLD